MNTIALKTLYILFTLVLVAFAAVQYNDPDPIIWISFYSICALVPLLLIFNRYDRRILWVGIALCLVHFVIAGPGIYDFLAHHFNRSILHDMSPERPYIEESREFLGTVIALVLMVTSTLLARKKLF